MQLLSILSPKIIRRYLEVGITEEHNFGVNHERKKSGLSPRSAY